MTSSKPEISLIAAIDNERGIARQGIIPWNLPGDKAYYRAKTLHHTIVMGRGTFASMNNTPLPDRKNIVVSRTPIDLDSVIVIHDLESYLNDLTENIWIIGGGQIYTTALPFASKLYLTRVNGSFGCDVFFPEFENRFMRNWKSEIMTENNIEYHFEIWEPKS